MVGMGGGVFGYVVKVLMILMIGKLCFVNWECSLVVVIVVMGIVLLSMNVICGGGFVGLIGRYVVLVLSIVIIVMIVGVYCLNSSVIYLFGLVL